MVSENLDNPCTTHFNPCLIEKPHSFIENHSTLFVPLWNIDISVYISGPKYIPVVASVWRFSVAVRVWRWTIPVWIVDVRGDGCKQ